MERRESRNNVGEGRGEEEVVDELGNERKGENGRRERERRME